MDRYLRATLLFFLIWVTTLALIIAVVAALGGSWMSALLDYQWQLITMGQAAAAASFVLFAERRFWTARRLPAILGIVIAAAIQGVWLYYEFAMSEDVKAVAIASAGFYIAGIHGFVTGVAFFIIYRLRNLLWLGELFD